MTNDQVSMILKLNCDFYKKIAKEFSQTRSSPWEGWGRVVEKISLPSGAKVLDLGCGNGRFYEYLTKNYTGFAYIGVDTSDELLKIAKNKFADANFLNLDIVTDNLNSLGKFDLITAFGVFHHIPTQELRVELAKKFLDLLNPGGFFVISMWDFDESKSRPIPLNLNFLEQGDFLLGWGNNRDALRYCHKYTDSEIKAITDELKTFGNYDVEHVQTQNGKMLIIC